MIFNLTCTNSDGEIISHPCSDAPALDENCKKSRDHLRSRQRPIFWSFSNHDNVTDLLATLTLGSTGEHEWKIHSSSAECGLSMVKNIDTSDVKWIASLRVPPYDGPAHFTCGSHWAYGYRRWLHGDCKCPISPSSFARSVRVHQHEWTWPLRRPRLRRKIRSVRNTPYKFHPCYDTFIDETGQVQTHTLVGPEVPTMRGRPEDRAWAKVANCGEEALTEFRSSFFCCPGELLWGACCAALLCCARLRCPLFSSRLTGTVPRTGNIFGQSTGVLYLATQVKRFSEGAQEGSVDLQ